MPRLSETEAWIKPFRRQVAITCGDGWYVRNNRGRMRLNVPSHGSLSLNFDWSKRGATQALPQIHLSKVCPDELLGSRGVRVFLPQRPLGHFWDAVPHRHWV